MAAVHRRMRALFFGVALILATAAGRVSADASAAAKHGDKDGSSKHGKGGDSCSDLSEDCGFVTAAQLAPITSGAIISVTGDGAGGPLCEVVDSENLGAAGCVDYDETTGTLGLGLICPEGYNIASTTCSPFDGDGFNLFGAQTSTNVSRDIFFCGMPVAGPIDPESEYAFILLATCTPSFGPIEDGAKAASTGLLAKVAAQTQAATAKMIAAAAAKKP